MTRKNCNFPMERTERHHFNQVGQLASPIMDKHHLPPNRSTRKDITSILCYICPRNIQPQYTHEKVLDKPLMRNILQRSDL